MRIFTSRLRNTTGGSCDLPFKGSTSSSGSCLSGCPCLPGYLLESWRRSPLQARGIKILPYLDDWLICAPTREQASRDTVTVLEHIDRLGLRVNLDKSNLAPAQRTVFLGVSLNTISMKACPSTQRVGGIVTMVSAFRRGRALPFVLYLRLLGMLTAASGVVPLGLLWLHLMQM